MTDPMEDRLRRAMHSAARRFPAPPVEAMSATRVQLAGRVRRRQRQVMSGVAAVVLFLAAGTVAFATARSGGSSSRQVAAGGADRSAPTTPASVDGSPVVGVTPGGSTPVAVVPSTTGGQGTTRTTTAPRGSTVPSTAVAPTVVPSTTATSTIPSTSPAPATSSGVRGTVLFSPTCPVEQFPPVPGCAPRPGPAHIQLVRGDGTVAAAGNAGSDGTFAISVAPGSYTVVAHTFATSAAIGRGCTASPSGVTVTQGRTETVAVSCDTGIR
ncbi:MAG: hypothetical protein QOF30_896 [Acidimicrobiaceae bacterium]|jgi:hypothetical protein|nr:hypothetical protein [Acidimicrobiaceae bacterium]